MRYWVNKSSVLTVGECTLWKNVPLAFVILGILGGCSDRPTAKVTESAVPSSPSNANAPSNPPAAPPVRARTHNPRDFMVEGRLVVDVMEAYFSPRATELGQRVQQAARANPVWWMEQAKKARPGQEMPYDERLGLSRAEYEEFLSYGRNPQSQKTGEAIVTITKKTNNVYVFDGGPALPELTGIELDLTNDVVRTPFGVFANTTDINATDNGAFGAWLGASWKTEEVDGSGWSGTAASFSMGRLKKSGRGVIHYRVKKVSLFENTSIRRFLVFDAPPRN